MVWEFRVMKCDTNGLEDVFVIAEAYYDDEENEDSVTGWSLGSEARWGEAPCGETLEELMESIESMRLACDKPVLDEAELLSNIKAGAE